MQMVDSVNEFLLKKQVQNDFQLRRGKKNSCVVKKNDVISLTINFMSEVRL